MAYGHGKIVTREPYVEIMLRQCWESGYEDSYRMNNVYSSDDDIDGKYEMGFSEDTSSSSDDSDGGYEMGFSEDASSSDDDSDGGYEMGFRDRSQPLFNSQDQDVSQKWKFDIPRVPESFLSFARLLRGKGNNRGFQDENNEEHILSFVVLIDSTVELIIQKCRTFKHTFHIINYLFHNFLCYSRQLYWTITCAFMDLFDALRSFLGYLYPYQALESNKCIRLLVLLPGSSDEDIRCRLLHTNLNDPRTPPYEALSYTWGGTVKNHSIWIGAYRVPVTANLHDALRHLRQNWPRFLWVDAICLNQEDINERSHQVKQMATIYQEASRVVVWLGTAKHLSPIALDFIPLLRRLRSKRDRNQSCVSKSPMVLSLQAMAEICQRSWWQRVWIIQEVASAKSNIVVQCGNSQWPWHAFVEGATLMREQREGSNFQNAILPPPLFRDDVIFNISKLDDIRKAKVNGGLDLLELLEKTRGSHATDKRDHVYGVLGLASSDCTAGFETDYAKSISRVNLDIARHLIQTRNDLALFGAQQEDVNEQSPSWVIDWSKRYDGIRILHHGSLYRAAKDSKASFRFLSNPATLAIQGITIGTIGTFCRSTHLGLFPWDKYIERRITKLRHFPWDKRVRRKGRLTGKLSQRKGRSQLQMTKYIVLPRQSNHDYGPREDIKVAPYSTSRDSFVEAYWRTLIGDSTIDGKEFPAPIAFGRLFEILHIEQEMRAHTDTGWAEMEEELAAIINKHYTYSCREKWVARLVSLRSKSHDALVVESNTKQRDIKPRYFPSKRGPSDTTNGNMSKFTPTTEFSEANFLKKRYVLPPVPDVPLFVPEIPDASKFIQRVTWDYRGRMFQITHNRLLFHNSNGYIGLAPDFARESDRICVFLGCDTPVIIRETDDGTYKLIGAAYVHGLMHGEALDYLEEQEADLEVFVMS